jgi:hypothetical protein
MHKNRPGISREGFHIVKINATKGAKRNPPARYAGYHETRHPMKHWGSVHHTNIILLATSQKVKEKSVPISSVLQKISGEQGRVKKISAGHKKFTICCRFLFGGNGML